MNIHNTIGYLIKTEFDYLIEMLPLTSIVSTEDQLHQIERIQSLLGAL